MLVTPPINLPVPPFLCTVQYDITKSALQALKGLIKTRATCSLVPRLSPQKWGEEKAGGRGLATCRCCRYFSSISGFMHNHVMCANLIPRLHSCMRAWDETRCVYGVHTYLYMYVCKCQCIHGLWVYVCTYACVTVSGPLRILTALPCSKCCSAELLLRNWNYPCGESLVFILTWER